MNDNSPILDTKIKPSFFNRLYWISKSLSIWLDPEVSKRASGPLESFTGGFNDSIHFSTIKVKFSKWHHQNDAKKNLPRNEPFITLGFKLTHGPK